MNTKDFNHIIHRLKDSLFRFSLRIVGRSDEAEDVVQEVFIKLWQKKSEMGHIQNLDAMLMRMVKNLSIDKTRSKHRKTEEYDLIVEQKNNYSPSPERQTEAKDALEKVNMIISSLPQKQKIVFQLRDIEQKTYEEISDILNIPTNQVKVNLHRARKTIRQQLLKVHAYGL